jgi:SAM-dependent methyltransferase
MSQGIDYTLHYRRYHDGSEKNWLEMGDHFLRSLGPYLPGDKQAEILDIGCGYGFGINGLKGAGYNAVIGFDSDPGQIAVARGRGLNAKHVPVADTLLYLGEFTGRFSLIYAFDVLEHIPHESQIPFLRAVAAALKPGGILVCRIPNALSPVGLYGRYNDWTHQSLFCRASLSFVLANAGLNFVTVQATNDPQPRRGLLSKVAVALVRGPVRILVRSMWRAVLASELGMGVALRDPITLNILAVAMKPV